MENSKLIIALDNMSAEQVENLIRDTINGLSPEMADKVIYKVHDMITKIGMDGIVAMQNRLIESGIDKEKINWMFDVKWNDIPNTVANYFRRLHESGLDNVRYLTTMVSGGTDMLRRAVETRNELGLKTKIIGVTIMTSFGDKGAREIFDDNAINNVLKLSKLALDAGVDALVNSSLEAPLLRYIFPDYDFDIITPGIRFEDNSVKADDQARVSTPKRAMELGVTNIVMGRPITLAEDKVGVIKRVLEDMEQGSYIPLEANEEIDFLKVLHNGSWEDLLKFIGAVYIRPEGGKYTRLTSMGLSDGYINIGIAERNYLVLERACRELAKKVAEKGIEADIVMGAEKGSIRLSMMMAKYLGVQTSIYAEKPGGDLKQSEFGSMLLNRHDVDLKGKKVIIAEDLINMGASIDKLIDLVKDKGGEVAAIIFIVNRSGKTEIDGNPIISVYDPKPFNIYYDDKTPENFRQTAQPLPEGSAIAEKPKYEWDELVRSMRG